MVYSRLSPIDCLEVDDVHSGRQHAQRTTLSFPACGCVQPLNSDVALTGSLIDKHVINELQACDVDGQNCARATIDSINVPQTMIAVDDIPATPVSIGLSSLHAPSPLPTCGAGNFGLVRAFNVAPSFSVAGLSLGLNIDHPYRTDLSVYLQSPSGTVATVISHTARTLAQNFMC